MSAIGRRMGARSSAAAAALATLAVGAAAALAERAMGRSPLCPCGIVRLWHGPVRSPENSQQLLDWYSLSHLVHGLIFYAATRIALPRWRWPARFVVPMLIEAAWEVAENSPIVIDRYRAVTVSWGYAGDSILNSMGDIGCMVIGFLIARRLPAWGSILLAIGCELVALAAIRDNLTLNILMLVRPIESILRWQAAA